MTSVSFAALGVAQPLLRALATENYLTPTPIQTQAIPLVLAGRDVLGIAQTGTGKTAAFGLPLLQLLAEKRVAPGPQSVRALILAPTRELALQIDQSLRTYGRHMGLRHAVILGGVSQHKQVGALRGGVDILVATPGRLLDLVNQKHVRLNAVSHLIIDEADRMFDMGFIRDVRRIVAAVPRQRHSMLFSATMPQEVAHLVAEILHQPVRVSVSPETMTADRVDQSVYLVEARNKRALLNELLRDAGMTRVIVFTRTKHGANKVVEHLGKTGHSAAAIHGNKSQSARQRALEDFRSGRSRVLVATDIAARGIDIDAISHVINFELPDVAETYVHRIGRTARAGSAGAAITFCDPSERDSLKAIERLVKQSLTRKTDHQAIAQDVSHTTERGHGERTHPERAHTARPAGKPQHQARRRFRSRRAA